MYNKFLYAAITTLLACPAAPLHADQEPPAAASMSATLTGIAQYGSFNDAFDGNGKAIDDQGRGAAKLDLEFGFSPTPDDEFHALLRIAAGNGMRDIWPGPLLPDAHDLEDDVKNINGHDRNYILQAWYKHDFHFGDDQSLAATGGIIDANMYLGQNEYADGEDVDFMNDAFVNPDTLAKPVYDLGGVAEFETGKWSLTGLVMHSRTGDATDNSYDYYAVQAGYHLNTAAGEGNYRLGGFSTTDDFLDAAATNLERRQGVAVSIAQPVSENFGVFAILVHQKRDAAVDHQNQLSGGLHINGNLWGRAEDAAGIAYAYLDGGNLDVDNSQVVEAYVRFQLNPDMDLGVDLQYLSDDLKTAPTRTAWVPGLRLNMSF